MMQAFLQEAAKRIARAQRLLITTGAGVSKESGVPTFRDAQEGLWAQYDPAQLATPQGFQRNPQLVWDWYAYRRQLVEQTTPNPGHFALATLENLLPHVVLVTQNVDNLHQRAGSRTILPLHGSLFAYKCAGDCQGDPTSIDLDAFDGSAQDTPPRCPHCQRAYVRPDVVWFGEALPAENLNRALDEAAQADVMLMVGTSNVVYPAAWIPLRALEGGAFVIEINPFPSEFSEEVQLHIPAPAGEALPLIIDAVQEILSA